MKIKYNKFGEKIIFCDNWGEFFAEFQKWHTKNKGVIPPEKIHNEKEFDHYVGFEGEGFGDFWLWHEKTERRGKPIPWEIWKDNGEMYAIETELGTFHKCGAPVNEPAALVLNLSANGSKIRYNDWKIQEEKAGKVLREIWTTGEIKNNYGLDLNWPKASQNEQSPEEENTPIKDKEHLENYENWTKEQLITEIKILKAEIEELKNDKFLSVCSKRFKLGEKQAKLEKMEKFVDSKTLDNSTNETDSNNTNYSPYVLGGMSILTVGIVIGFLVRKKVKKSK